MTQVLVICVVAILIILMLRGINRPGIMLALMWATYVIEQVILQNPFFLSRSWLTNVLLTLATTAVVGKAFLKGSYTGLKPTSGHILIALLYGLARMEPRNRPAVVVGACP